MIQIRKPTCESDKICLSCNGKKDDVVEIVIGAGGIKTAISLCGECRKELIGGLGLDNDEIPAGTVCIKATALKRMPEYCEDDCVWYGIKSHPAKGWTEMCELMWHCMDDDQPEEWIYDGNGRPKACPLVEYKGGDPNG